MRLRLFIAQTDVALFSCLAHRFSFEDDGQKCGVKATTYNPFIIIQL